MPNSIVFSNPGASIIRWGDGVAAPYLTLSVNGSSALVGAAVTGTVTNTGSAAGQWSVASAPADVLISPSSGTLAVNAFSAFTLTALAAGVKTITLSSSTPGATIVGSPVSLTATSPVPAPPPPPSAPIAPSAAYRNGQAYLFNSIVAAVEPSRISGGSDLNLNTVGPMRDYVDGAGWAWDNVGGDWIDSTLTRQGSSHWATMSTPAAGAVTTTYSASVTTALQLVRSAGRWNAWIVSRGTGGSVRTIAARFNTTEAYRPRIEVVYTDATTATLACRVSSFLGSGSSIPDQASPTYSMSTANNTGEIALEFDLPTKDITSATLYFTVTNHWGASCNINFNLADPPLNTDPVTLGYSEAYPLDAGISGHASTIFSHRYNNGTSLSDYQYTATAIDWEVSTAWDPALTGGASDTSKLPHVGQGKWVGGFGAGTTVVSDSYTGEGFVALASGMGALKVVMDKAAGIADGVEGGQSGTGAANCHLFLPSAKIGARNLFVRYYLRIGNTSDTNSAGPYRTTLAQQYHVLKQGVPTWSDMAGKCSIGFAHKTKYGGNSGSAGGGYGWTMRQEFGDYTKSTDSPSAGGWNRSWSWTDYQGNNVVGHRYGAGDNPSGVTLSREFHGLAQRGGLGSNLYADRWYCIEEEIYLNSVNAASGAGDGKDWTADGYLRCWIDGRLVYDQGNVVMRSKPLETWSSTYQPAIADLGVLSMWFNWFHGGLTQNTINRVAFVTGLVVGESRIGPMKIPATWPFTLPASGTIGTISTNVLTNVTDGANENFSLSAVLGAWGSAAVSLIKTGSTVTDIIYWIFGGGHGDTANDAVYAWRASTGLFYRALAPSASAVTLMAGPSTNATTDTANGEDIFGRPDSQHAYGHLQALDSDDTHGPALMQLFGSGIGSGAIVSSRAHRFDANTNTWERWSNVPGHAAAEIAFTAKDTLRQKFLRFPSNNGTAFYTLDYTNSSANWQVLAQSGRISNWDYSYTAFGTYDPVRDLVIGGVMRGVGSNLCGIDAGALTGAWTELTFTANAAYTSITTATRSGGSFGGPGTYALGLYHRAVDDTFVMIDNTTNPPTGVWILTPPVSSPLTNAWTWSRRAFTGTSSLTNATNNQELYDRFRYVEALDAFIVCPRSTGQMECWKF